MKDIFVIATSAIALTAAGVLLRPKKAYAWLSETHSDITEKALELLNKEKMSKLYSFYSGYAAQLKKGCVDPDHKGDVDKGTGTHYYSCATAKGKRLELKCGYYPNRLGAYAKSARTMLEDNYSCALSLYKNNKVEQAMYYLGRALHFLEDMSNPVHAAGMKLENIDTNPHKAFEKQSVSLAKEFSPAGLDKGLAENYSEDSLESPINKLCKAANKYAPDIAKLDPSALETAVRELVPLAAQNAAALLIRFYDDCLKDNGNFLLEGRAYTIKNAASGKLVTVTSKGIVLDKSGREKEQSFLPVISNSGTFALKTAAGLFVNDKFKSVGKLSGKNGAQFRFTALGKDCYRISSESTGFSRFLTENRSGMLSFEPFEPEDKSQVWIIR